MPHHSPATRHIKSERRQMERIFVRAGATNLAAKNAFFFAGTMFWFRPAALELFGLFVEDAGYRVVSLEPDAADGTQIELEDA